MGLNDAHDTSLQDAVRFSDFDCVLKLLNDGHDPNTIGLYKWNCLHESSHNGEYDILRILLNKKGDPNQVDELNLSTPLHYASKEGHVDCVLLLLQAGSMVNVRNVEGLSPLDISTDECRNLLEEALINELKTDENVNDKSDEASITEDTDYLSELTDLSIYNSSFNESFDSFLSAQSSDIFNKKGNENLGFIELSFEYNSKRNLLKIRVWQIGDILLPPPHTSTISGIYVKSFLLPDHMSKQRTEIIRVNQSVGHKLHTHKSGVQHIYTPTSFSFTKPLIYSNINDRVIAESRRLRFEVCIMQRYTRKSFLVAMLTLDIKDAVKKLIRDKYPLIPCSNPTLPVSMSVHDGMGLNILKLPDLKSQTFHSNPELHNLSLTSLQTQRASSELDLHTVIVSKPPSPIATVVIAMPDETERESVPLSTICVYKNAEEIDKTIVETKLNMGPVHGQKMSDDTASNMKDFIV